MTAINRFLLAAAILAPLATAPPLARAQDTFVTSGGIAIRLAPAGDLSCQELLAKIDEIDATGYRGLRAGPRDPRDRRLFEYESAVSNRYYSSCGATGASRTSATEILRGGFKPRATSN
ncbi:MAG: hypothetical protein ACU0DT_13095 [Albimonas sp.]|uniref:hypothetical protein n=1 Tax=Albimonas sp. TaxID=1872425 RepID=UPI00405620EB|tara:strand:- start:505 stop:861 length:357 start_codon:yes stop_codon:yes gene_type:complete